jgi:aryl carrier-like protein
MRPVPDGSRGEIYVGGAGVARGYFGKARESAERFVPDPFAQVPGQVLYRTGDLGLRRTDGEFEFLGRIDRQVKVRGFRVEPGEVEVVLDSSEAVASAAVVARRGPDGDRRLVAYVVPATAGGADIEELRDMAARELPEYMRPSYYVLMEELPLDPNGKVDRRALPDPWRSRDETGMGPFTAPRNGAEEVIALIISESLGLDRVGRDDDFFAIGGNSLQSVGVLERLRALGLHIRAAEFFGRPTVAALADLMQERLADGGAAGA